MKTILVPTDFSPASVNAFNYAVALAAHLQLRIVLLHTYEVIPPVSPVSFEMLNDERQQLRWETNRRLNALAASENKPVNCETLSLEGDAVDAILHVAKEKMADLIVMGISGDTSLGKAIFGSTSSKVMEKAKCPVMAIPESQLIDRPTARITYATDYHQSDLAAINLAAEIARASNAQLNVLHISDAMIGADEEKTLMAAFRDRVKSSTHYHNMSFEILHGENIEDRLNEYIQAGSTDMLMMSTHYPSFVDRLFGRSLVKEMARGTSIPIVAFHHNAKTAATVY